MKELNYIHGNQRKYLEQVFSPCKHLETPWTWKHLGKMFILCTSTTKVNTCKIAKDYCTFWDNIPSFS